MIHSLTRKLEQSERQLTSNMTEEQRGEYEIRKAGFDLGSMKASGFRYDPEYIASPVRQAEQFCETMMCAANDW